MTADDVTVYRLKYLKIYRKQVFLLLS